MDGTGSRQCQVVKLHFLLIGRIYLSLTGRIYLSLTGRIYLSFDRSD